MPAWLFVFSAKPSAETEQAYVPFENVEWFLDFSLNFFSAAASQTLHIEITQKPFPAIHWFLSTKAPFIIKARKKKSRHCLVIDYTLSPSSIILRPRSAELSPSVTERRRKIHVYELNTGQQRLCQSSDVLGLTRYTAGHQTTHEAFILVGGARHFHHVGCK